MKSYRFFFPSEHPNTLWMEGNVYMIVFPIFPEIATLTEHGLTRRRRFGLWKRRLFMLVITKTIATVIITTVDAKPSVFSKSCGWNIAKSWLMEFWIVRSETLRTRGFWNFFKFFKFFYIYFFFKFFSKWSVPKHCEITTTGKFPNGPFRNIANS